MKNRRLPAALLAAALTFMTLGTAPVAHATPPEFELKSLTLNRGKIAVSSLNTVPVTVTVWAAAEPTGFDTFYVGFAREDGAAPLLYSEPLKLLEGELMRDKWQGVVNVPSTVNGTIKATQVVAGRFHCLLCPVDNPHEVNGVAAPTLKVLGTHIPKISATFTPKRVPAGKPFTLKWTVTDSQTGKPYGPRIRMTPAKGACGSEGQTGRTVLSDLNGAVTVKASDTAALYCLQLPGNPASIARLATSVPSVPVISAVPSRTSAPVGAVVPVEGKAATASGCTVNLQRLYGATAWRTVSTAKVRSSSRFTLTAQPAYQGNIPYRAQLPACRNMIAGVSKTFTIKGI
ncbi:hypothetical protein OG474_16690 [Kribbella sp. NBC_01505]|uniref:hypothetical protein n=1 Tax=Kribbella sp. NBC_01505 TaxID=2903580 RepID=UPI003869919F